MKLLSIDETSSKKGHNYLTILSDAKEKKVVGIGVVKNKEAVVAGIQEMESRGSKASKVKEVAIDLSPAYTSAVLEHFEKASLVYDRFHVEQLNHWERTPLIILDDFGLQPLDQQIRLASTNIHDKQLDYLWALNQTFHKKAQDKFDRIVQ